MKSATSTKVCSKMALRGRLCGIITILFLSFSFQGKGQDSLRIDSNGMKLKRFYSSLNVEHLWLAGNHINWETGEADKPGAKHNTKTHCSAFAAAACKKLGIYILCPPQHPQGLLANAQFEWLKTNEAADDGWKKITDADIYSIYARAQEYADKGYVVIAIYKNPEKNKPGHAAFVMPENMTMSKIKEDGPEEIQAGANNYDSTCLRIGFEHHIKEWPESKIVFYYNIKRKL